MVLECSTCTNLLDDREFKPVTGTCGHTLCINCCRALDNRKCPTCNREFAFLDEIVNYQLIELINACKVKEAEQRKRGSKKKKGGLDQPRCKCSECDLMMKMEHSRICLSCSVNQGIVRLDKNIPKILDEQKAEKVIFCPNCALEGVHQRHTTTLYSNLKMKHQIEKRIDHCCSVKICRSASYLNLATARSQFITGFKETVAKENITNAKDGSRLMANFMEVADGYESILLSLEINFEAAAQKIKGLTLRLQPVPLENEATKSQTLRLAPSETDRPGQAESHRSKGSCQLM